ncbi:MAG: Holliday junction branch migration protein RuvA [Thermodesulfobacteriota bacterium]
MIAYINGIIIHKSTDSVVVDVGGVGYELFIPLSTYYNLPDEGASAAFRVHTHHKDDAINLYGFLTGEEKELFRLLIGVSGVGPRLARNILSGITVADLAAAIGSGDRAALSAVPGVGAKSAERLIMELKDKVAALAVAAGGGDGPGEAGGGRAGEGALGAGQFSTDPDCVDAVSALENLGYRAAGAADAVKKARELIGEGQGFEPIFKEALKLLSKK